MELATIIGIVSGVFFLIFSIFMSSGFEIAGALAFANMPSVMITLGGTAAAMFVAFPVSGITQSFKSAALVFRAQKTDPADVTAGIVRLAGIARRQGILALDEAAEETGDEFLQKATMLLVDGTDQNQLRDILETELASVRQRHNNVIKLWEFIASVAPAWGMIGTLIGLILMLRQITDPSSIAPAMATALVTTFYGVVLANFIASPIAGKLRLFSEEEIFLKTAQIEGIIAIHAGENSRVIEEKMRSFIAPSMRGRTEYEKRAFGIFGRNAAYRAKFGESPVSSDGE